MGAHMRPLQPHRFAQQFFGAELRHRRIAAGLRFPSLDLAVRCDEVLEAGGTLTRLHAFAVAKRDEQRQSRPPGQTSARQHPRPDRPDRYAAICSRCVTTTSTTHDMDLRKKMMPVAESLSAGAASAAQTQMSQGIARPANDLLRSARRSRQSPSGSGRVLSRQELADGCNQILFATYANAGHARRWAGITATYVGALERGEVRWPNRDYRAALRTFFNATNAELGLYIDRPERLDAGPQWAGQEAP